jgi:hypothetical protein
VARVNVRPHPEKLHSRYVESFGTLKGFALPPKVSSKILFVTTTHGSGNSAENCGADSLWFTDPGLSVAAIRALVIGGRRNWGWGRCCGRDRGGGSVSGGRTGVDGVVEAVTGFPPKWELATWLELGIDSDGVRRAFSLGVKLARSIARLFLFEYRKPRPK